MSSRGCLALLMLLAASAALGEERFYPIMGPDGRMQMIRGEAGRGASPDSSAQASQQEPELPGRAALPGGGLAAPADVIEPSEKAEGAGNPPAAASRQPQAVYDSDEYMDSEAMEAATPSASEGRKRFYLVQDGMGQHVSESDVPLDGPVSPPRTTAPVEASVRWEALTTAGSVWLPTQVAADMPWLPACFPDKERGQWELMVAGEGQEVVVDRPDLAFVANERVHSAWRLEGEGPRTLVVHSYGRSQRKPVFLDPRLAFLDGRGCVTRVVQGWFDRRYAANDRRHAYLRADLVVHTGEEAVMLLLPPEQDKLAAAGPWQSSRTGQLKFTLKK